MIKTVKKIYFSLIFFQERAKKLIGGADSALPPPPPPPPPPVSNRVMSMSYIEALIFVKQISAISQGPRGCLLKSAFSFAIC